MLLAFDTAADAIAEHDDWHTHEHLPKRLAIPGFLRGTRWVSLQAKPMYVVLYEVESLATLQSRAYLDRLDNPTPWTSKMMQSYRGMTRGLCGITARSGMGLGAFGLLLRFTPPSDNDSALRSWLRDDALPRVAAMRGLGSAWLLEQAAAAPMTNEQRIRGADAGIDWALFVTGYSDDALAALLRDDLASDRFEAHGVGAVSSGLYRLHYTLADRDGGA